MFQILTVGRPSQRYAKRQVGQLPIKASARDEGEEPQASSFRSGAGSASPRQITPFVV
jgi:hypothetical protein